MKVVVDSSVLVGLINPRDLWRERVLRASGAELLYFDCVATEAISAAVRRLHEKGHAAEVVTLISQLHAQVPASSITWILPEVLDLVRSSSGALNFHDALIALACRERGIPAIASFDADFDQVAWLRRLAHPQDVVA